jgi:hypothetical protein
VVSQALSYFFLAGAKVFSRRCFVCESHPAVEADPHPRSYSDVVPGKHEWIVVALLGLVTAVMTHRTRAAIWFQLRLTIPERFDGFFVILHRQPASAIHHATRNAGHVSSPGKRWFPSVGAAIMGYVRHTATDHIHNEPGNQNTYTKDRVSVCGPATA